MTTESNLLHVFLGSPEDDDRHFLEYLGFLAIPALNGKPVIFKNNIINSNTFCRSFFSLSSPSRPLSGEQEH